MLSAAGASGVSAPGGGAGGGSQNQLLGPPVCVKRVRVTWTEIRTGIHGGEGDSAGI